MDEKLSGPDFGTGKKDIASYTIGLILCIALTLVPFYVVTNPQIFDGYAVKIIFLAAFLQFFVQVKCFLRLNYLTEQARLNVLSFVFCGALLLIILLGSLWIMYNLDYNMMH